MNDMSNIKKNLAFYKSNEKPWTLEQAQAIAKYVGSKQKIERHNNFLLESNEKYIFDYGNRSTPLMACWNKYSQKNLHNCTKIEYYDIFDKNNKQYQYPLYFQLRDNSIIVEFTGLTYGTVVKESDKNEHKLGYYKEEWSKHTNCKNWTQIEKPIDINIDSISIKEIKQNNILGSELIDNKSYDQYKEWMQYTKNTKENTMNDTTICDTNIEIKIDGKELCLKNNKPKKLKTMLQKANKYVTEWFDQYGDLADTTNHTPKQATKILQNPSSIGFTFRCYKLAISKTTSIPVVEVD